MAQEVGEGGPLVKTVEGGVWIPRQTVPVTYEDWIPPSSEELELRQLVDEGKGQYILEDEAVTSDDETTKIHRRTRYLVSKDNEVYQQLVYVADKEGYKFSYKGDQYEGKLELVGKGRLQLVPEDVSDVPEKEPRKYILVIESQETSPAN